MSVVELACGCECVGLHRRSRVVVLCVCCMAARSLEALDCPKSAAATHCRGEASGDDLEDGWLMPLEDFDQIDTLELIDDALDDDIPF